MAKRNKPLKKGKKDKKANNLEEIAVEQDVNAAAAAQKNASQKKKKKQLNLKIEEMLFLKGLFCEESFFLCVAYLISFNLQNSIYNIIGSLLIHNRFNIRPNIFMCSEERTSRNTANMRGK